MWKNLRRVVLVVDMVAYTHPFGRARTGMRLPRGDFSTVGGSSDSTRELYTARRTLYFRPVREIDLRRTSGGFFLQSCPGAMRHQKRKGTRGGYAMDAREQLAALILPDFIPVET
jgi:hypothetical protein